MNHEEIKRYFENNPPPKEVQLRPWANITDTQVFLKSCYSTIRNFNGPMERCPAWWHLRDFYILMKKTAQQSASQATEKTPAEETAAEETAAEETPTKGTPSKETDTSLQTTDGDPA